MTYTPMNKQQIPQFSRRRKHRHITLITLCVCSLCLITLWSAHAAPHIQHEHEEVVITIDRQMPDIVSKFRTGFTHTQYSMNWGGDPESVASAKRLLRESAHFQNQHIMGWGVHSPEPAPGIYDWESLDSRVQMIRSMDAEPVLTLCCAPDWMKGGISGTTDWSQLELAPLPEYYDDFADLAREVALRYPDVQYFQVWNEMKGFWDGSNNNWDYAAYTELYNHIYDALKSVDSDIQVGGFYMVIEGTGSHRGDWSTQTPITPRQITALDYWLQHKQGADFIVLSRSVQDYHDHHSYTTAELIELTPAFEHIARQIRERTDLPIWWGEYYISGTEEAVAARNALAFYYMVKGGSSAALLWNPMEGEINYPLFSDVQQEGGGQPLPNYHQFHIFHQEFSAGTQLYKAHSSSPDVAVLASDQATLLINTRDADIAVRLNGTMLTLNAYEVRLVDAPNVTSTPAPTTTPYPPPGP